MYKVINFFKSYKVDVLNTNVIYKLDDRLGNWIKIIDEIKFRYNFLKTDMVYMDDFINNLNVYLHPTERIIPREKMYTDITYWVQKIFKDYMEYWDEIVESIISMILKEWANLKWDGIYEYSHLYEWNDVVKVDDHTVDTNVHLVFKERVELEDMCYREVV